MVAEEILTALRDCGFLQELSDEHLGQLASIARPVEFEEGATILREGETAKDMFIILSGRVSLEICSPSVGCRRIMTLNSGELLSWSAVLQQGRQTATARTISPVKALAVDGCQLFVLCEHDPAFGFAFIRRVALAMTSRLTAARMQLLNVFGSEMPSVPNHSSN